MTFAATRCRPDRSAAIRFCLSRMARCMSIEAVRGAMGVSASARTTTKRRPAATECARRSVPAAAISADSSGALVGRVASPETAQVDTDTY